MSQGSIKAFSTVQINVPANSFISVRTLGSTEVTCSFVPKSSSYVDSGQVVGFFANDEKTFFYPVDVVFTISANADPVSYQIKPRSPSAIDFVPVSMGTAHVLSDDFDYFNPDDWTETKTDAAASAGLSEGDGGTLFLVNSSDVNDLNSIQKKAPSVSFENGKKLFFEALLRVDDKTDGRLAVGLVATTATPFSASNGLYFRKLNGSTFLSIVAAFFGQETVIANVAEISSDWFSVGYKWDGVGENILIYFNGFEVASVASSSIPLDAALAPTFAIVNGSDEARTMAIDYYQVVKSR
jgi:hypothetical protein